MNNEIKPEAFYVSGVQRVGRQYVFYKLKIENGEITSVDAKEPENLATVIERLKLDQLKTILGLSEDLK